MRSLPVARGLTVVDLFWCLNVYADILVPRGVQTPVDGKIAAFGSQVRVAADPNHLRQV